MEIVEQGAIRVNTYWVFRRSEDICCVELDLHSKYADAPIQTHTRVGDGPSLPGLILTAGEQTLYTDPEYPKDSCTIIEFTEFEGWEIFSCSGPGRYTVCLVFVKEIDNQLP